MIEDLAKCNMKAPSESLVNNSRTKGSGVIELNKMTTMGAKLDAKNAQVRESREKNALCS